MGEKISLSFRKDKNKYFRRQITVAGALVHFKNFKTIWCGEFPSESFR